MGRRIAVNSTTTVSDLQHITPVTVKKNIRKRKYVGSGKSSTKASRTNSNSNDNWHENADDEDSSSNDTVDQMPARNLSSKHANNSSILLNSSLSASIGASASDLSPLVNESPKPVYVLRPSMVNGTILSDLGQQPWRLGRPIGKGNFGEIFLASNNITVPVTNDNAKFVVKIEPHSNGPLFVEIHCLMNTAKKNCLTSEPEASPVVGAFASIDQEIPQMAPSGIPEYIASGSHYFGDARYRFLVLQRFDRDLHSLMKNTRVQQKSVLTLAVHILTVLENLHNKGYCHNDVKAQNLMISKCKFYKTKLSKTKRSIGGGSAVASKSSASKSKMKMNFKGDKYHYEEKQQTTDSGNSSEQEPMEDDDDEDFVIKRESRRRAKRLPLYDDHDGEDDDDDEDFDDGATSNSVNTNSLDGFETPVHRNSRPRRTVVQFSGSNPVRSCRREKPNAVYDEMVKSHYLRPTKRVSYSEFFNDDILPLKEENGATNSRVVSSDDDDSEEFLPNRKSLSPSKRKRSRRTQETHAKSNYQEHHRSSRRCRIRNNSQHSLENEGASNEEQDGDEECSQHEKQYVLTEEERIFLIDYGLASKYMDDGIHRPFIMDQRRAHDGTLEFTSRDAHMGAHSRRSDLECLGYNLIYWSQGYLPWKEAAQQQQQEKVHRAKEFLMTDVREMLKQIYGKQVPKYLGEFLHQVGQLNFHDRPNYERYRNIFKREFENLGYDSREMTLDSQEIIRTSVKVKDEVDTKCDIFELNKHNALAWSALKNCSYNTPYQENGNGVSRISPKNLRSKSDKKTMKKKKFSWAEILSQDPDQIARERAEKEFTREEESNDVQQRSSPRVYEGKPTYAILEIQKRLMEKGKLQDYIDERNRILNSINSREEKHRDGDADGDDDEEEEEEEQEMDDDEDDDDDNEAVDQDEDSEKNEADDDEEGEEEEDVEEEQSEDSSDEEKEEERDEPDFKEDDVDMISEPDENTKPLPKKRGRPRKQQQPVEETQIQNPKKSSSKSKKSSLTLQKTNGNVAAAAKKSRKKSVTFSTNTKTSKQSKAQSTLDVHSSSSSSSSSCSTSLSSSSSASNSSSSTTNQKINNNNYNNKINKRGSATRHNRKTSGYNLSEAMAASAAGEVELNGHFKNDDDDNKPLSQRRTRRCLLKTEKAMRNAVLVDQEDSNSNFSPDMRNLYLNNENMYYKSSLVAAAAAAASKHCRK